MHKKHSAVLAVAGLAFLLTGFFANPNFAQAVACASGAAAQNGITVTPSHGQAFYYDPVGSGNGVALDAGYIGYQVTNATGGTKTNLWTEVSSFTGGVLSLVNDADSAMHLPSLANNATGISYFMVKASGATASAQTHTVKVYNGRPGLAGSTVLYQCTYSFSSVVNTNAANANKIADTGLGTAAAIEVSTTTPELGKTVVVTVEGQTGTIGAGAAPDNSIIWLAPSSVSSWPTRALRLETVSIIFDINKNWNNNPVGDQLTYNNQLLITNAKNTIGSAEYRATYTFRVIGRSSQTVDVVPASQIASGTQIKHSDISSNGSTYTFSFSGFNQNTFLTKSVTATSGLNVVNCTNTCVVPGFTPNTSYTEVPYKLEATTTSPSITLDEFIDVPGSGAIFKPGSAKVTDVGRTNVTIPDAALLSSESALSPQPLHFDGLFNLTSARSAFVTYTMYLKSGTYGNTGYAKIASTDIGNTIASYSTTTVTSNGTSSITYNQGSSAFPITATTNAATNVSVNSATLNGTIDPNGNSPLTAQFEYGTDPNLAGATTTTATTPASGNIDGLFGNQTIALDISGLSESTTYYFRVKAGTAQGQIRSFVTPAQILPPTPVAEPATGISFTGATLNGQVNPNNSSVTAVQFVYSPNPNIPAGSSTYVTLDSGSGTPLTLGGNTTQPVTTSITGLVAGTPYYYKVRACTGALSGSFPNISCNTYVDSNKITFIAANPPTVTTVAATNVGSTTAQLNGTVNPNFETATVSFDYGTDPTLQSGVTTVTSGTISGSTVQAFSDLVNNLAPVTTYYFRASASNAIGSVTDGILSFTTSAVNRTLAFDPNSYQASYNFSDIPPTVVAIPSAGSGTITYDSNTPDVCTVNPNTGAVTFVTYGLCELSASIAANGIYSDASATPIQFNILSVERTLTIDPASYDPAYNINDISPTITATPSMGGGDITFTSLTPEVCSILATTGKVSFITVGVCSISADITLDRGYNAATSEPISFTIAYVNRTLAIEENSFTANYSYFDTPPTLVANPSAGLGDITFTSLTTSVCTVDPETGEVTFLRIGTCEIYADITNDGTYDVATAEKITIEIYGVNRTLTIDPASYVAEYLFTDTPPTIVATPSAGGGNITYSSNTHHVCTIDSETGVVTFHDAGTCEIGAHITEDGGYYAADATPISFVINAISRTLTIDPESYANRYFITDNEPTITSTPSAGAGTKTYTSYTLDVCTIGSHTGNVHFLTVGTCEIGANIADDPGYNDADADHITFTIVEMQSRDLTIDPTSFGGPYSFTDAPPTIVATPSAGGGTITYSSNTPDVCTVDPNTGVVTFISAGTCELGANITEDDIYYPADADPITFVINKADRTLSIDPTSYVASYLITDNGPTIVAIPSAGDGNITYSSLTEEICTINSHTGVVTILAVGTCTIGAEIDADGGYNAATADPISFEITKVPRTLTIDPESYVNTYSIDANAPTIVATPSAGGGTITYSSNTPDVCTIDANTGEVTFVSAGTCEIGANITGDDTYDDADATPISFTIVPLPLDRSLTIDSESYNNRYFITDSAPTITSTPSAGAGTKTYTSYTTDVCTIDANTGEVTFVSAGTCEIGANIAGDPGYNDADAEHITFTIVEMQSRTLTIDPGSFGGPYSFTDAPPTIVATPSAGGGTITYSSNTPDVCTVDPNTGVVTFISAGTCELGANITEDDIYYPADADPITFVINKADRTLSIDPGSYNASYFLTDSAPTITSTPSAGAGTKTYTSYTTDVCTIDANTGEVTFVSAGTCEIGANIADDPGYNDADADHITFVVNSNTELLNRTLTINSRSYLRSYRINDSKPTITSTPSAGAGTKTYTSYTLGVCTINPSTGKVTFISTGTCEIGANIAGDPNYNDADAEHITFTITAASRIISGGGGGGGGGSRTSPTNNPTPTNSPSPAAPTSPNSPAAPAAPEAPQEVCEPYLTKFIKLGANNDSDEVVKLQNFLNQFENEGLVVDGVYKQADYEAVLRFQAKYSEILKTWNLTAPTGYVYTATQETINRIYCEQTNKITCPYFTGYFDLNQQGEEVPKIRAFLNQQMGALLDTTSFLYDLPLFNLVKSFQAKYADKVLTPWGLTSPTGRWYQSTRKLANDLVGCGEAVRLDNGVLLSR